ncbi:MAG: hypothetical protein ACE5R4_07265 [Armatimonadota bacterium]
MNREWKIGGGLLAIFVVAYFLPLSDPKVKTAWVEAFKLLQWYARNHTLACVVPALWSSPSASTSCCKPSD